MCSCSPFSSLPLIFTLLVASISHFEFLTAAIKFSCCFCNEMHILCFSSLALALSLLKRMSAWMRNFTTAYMSRRTYGRTVGRSRDYQNSSYPLATIFSYPWSSPINDEQHRKTLCDPSRSFKSHNLFLGWYLYGLCRHLNFLGDCAHYFLHSF